MRAAVALVAASGLPLDAAAATISGLGLANGSTNVFDDAGGVASVAQSSLSTLTFSGSSFEVRYAAVVGADAGGTGSATFTQNFAGDYTISFSVTELVSTPWLIDVDVSRLGAQTIVSDGSGNANVVLGALTGTPGGAASLSAGSLGLGAVTTLSNASAPGSSPNSAFSQSTTATLSGVGTGAAQLVTLHFTFAGSATTIDPPGGQLQGDEAALRMGIDGALSFFTADDYPGPGSRTLANDGIFVEATVRPMPEPETALLFGAGLLGLGIVGRRRRPARPGCAAGSRAQRSAPRALPPGPASQAAAGLA